MPGSASAENNPAFRQGWPEHLTDQDRAEISRLCQDRQPGFTLQRAFYLDPTVYRADLEAFWRSGWVFAGHLAEIPKPGDYLLCELDGESLIVLNDGGEEADPQVRVFYNTCSHRGSLICTEKTGHVGKLACPYHRWTYNRDGSLCAARGFEDQLSQWQRQRLGLVPAEVREVAGLIFISLAESPPPFEPAARAIAAHLTPHGLRQAKLAHTIEYQVSANWKLVWENNRECYHCVANHPEYIQANYDLARDHGHQEQQIQQRLDQCRTLWQAEGLTLEGTNVSSAMSADWYRANRTPLRPGFVTESLDGRQVAPLMGSFRSAEVGTCRVTTWPNFWLHASCDHAVSTRLLPAGPQETHIQVSWLVDADAVEGRDYQLDRLLPFWQRTSEQDWEICRWQQSGIRSRRYRPGPYSQQHEANVEVFLHWYLQQLHQWSARSNQATPTDTSADRPTDQPRQQDTPPRQVFLGGAFSTG